MAATTWTADDVGGNTAGATTRVKLALEKADNSFIAGQAGAGGGLAVEGVVGGTPVPVSGTVTAAVDTSALATAAKQDDNIDAIEDLQSATVYKYYAAFAADTNLVTDGGGLCRRIVVGTSGTLVLTKNDDTDETLPAEICTDGAVLDLRAKVIRNTSTATKVLVMW